MIDEELDVYIGGGDGLRASLEGSRGDGRRKVAIVTGGDDGGSTGEIRKADSSVPPTGDVRKASVGSSLKGGVLGQLLILLFEHRFNGSDSIYDATIQDVVSLALDEMGYSRYTRDILREMSLHLPLDFRYPIKIDMLENCVGNLIIYAAEKVADDPVEGIKKVGRLLECDANIIVASPFTYTLCYVVQDEHDLYFGESRLDERESIPPIQEFWVDPVGHEGERIGVPAHQYAIESIQRAYRFIVAPGSHFGSIMAAHKPDGITDAIRKRPDLLIIQLINAATEKNQTSYPDYGVEFSPIDHITGLIEVLGRLPNMVVAHDFSCYNLSYGVEGRYREKGCSLVRCDRSVFQREFNDSVKLVPGNILYMVYNEKAGGPVFRHNPSALRRINPRLFPNYS